MLKELTKNRTKQYDVTIFQTPVFKERKGYKQVYRLKVAGMDHEDCLESVFSMFNVSDRLPADFNGRFLWTGDILLIDEERNGLRYYQLKSGGWERIQRIHVR